MKYTNKILHDIGLCVCLFDFQKFGEPFLYPSEGSTIILVKFRLVLFRPFIGEIITGKIISSGRDGVRVSLNFFDDILIPVANFQQPTVYNPSTELWSWKYEGNELCMEIGEKVRIVTSLPRDATITRNHF